MTWLACWLAFPANHHHYGSFCRCYAVVRICTWRVGNAHTATFADSKTDSNIVINDIPFAGLPASAPAACLLLLLLLLLLGPGPTGALEYNAAGLNRTWFFPQPAKGQLPGSHWHAIYAASFKTTGTAFPLAWAPEDESVPGVDVTQAYLDAADKPTALTLSGPLQSTPAAVTQSAGVAVVV